MANLFDLVVRVAHHLGIARTGTASSGSWTTMVDSDLANIYPDDFFNTGSLLFSSGDYQYRDLTITDYTGASGTFTFANQGLAVGDGYSIGGDLVSGRARLDLADDELQDLEIAGTYADDYFNGCTIVITWPQDGSSDTRTITDFEGDTGIFHFAAAHLSMALAPYYVVSISLTGTLTAYSSISATDSALAATYPDDLFNGLNLTLTSGNLSGDTIAITDYDADGIFSFSALDPFVGSGYIALSPKYPLDVIRAMINMANHDIGRWHEVVSNISTVANQTEYDIGPTIDDIREVYVSTSTTSGAQRWKKIYNWRLTKDLRGNNILNVPQFSAGYYIRIIYITEDIEYTALTDTINYSAYTNLLVYSAVVKCLIWRKQKIGEGDSTINELLNFFQDRYREVREEYTPTMVQRTPRLLIPGDD